METDNIRLKTPEVRLQRGLEAPYITIVRDIVHAKIPEHKDSFDITLDEINRQITGEGLFIFNSKKYPGVSFLAGHLSVTPELIEKIAEKHQEATGTNPEPTQPSSKDRESRLEHYAYFIQPSFGIPPDGSALSALDMAIDRFIREMPKVAAAIKRAENPPTVDIYIAGGPLGLGGKVTDEFAGKVMGANGEKAEGFGPYGEIYAEFVQDNLPRDKETLKKTRIVLQGASKGSITSDLTTHNLPEDIKARTQRLYDNPGGVQGRNIPTQIGRSVNLGLGMTTEIAIRQFAGTVRNGAFATQSDFYKAIAKDKNLPQDDENQKKLKGDMFFRVGQFLRFGGGGEMRTLGHGTPLDKEQRSYSRISTPDPVNINFSNLVEVAGRSSIAEKARDTSYRIISEIGSIFGKRMEPRPRRALVARQKGRVLIFATSNRFHNFPWERSVSDGSWAQKMEFVENTPLPKQTS